MKISINYATIESEVVKIMLTQDLVVLIQKIQAYKTEFADIEVKEAHEGCPRKLYDTISSFSNQNGGGVIVFGLSEEDNFAPVGVYNVSDLQKKVNEQCKQMKPIVRPLFTLCEIDGKRILAAEIPEIDVAYKPCFYKGKGRLGGSYIRVGDSDEQMSEYEIYSYEAFRNKYQDDTRVIDRAKYEMLDENWIDEFIIKLKTRKPKLSHLEKKDICELMSITKDGIPTMAGVMLFSKYPQAFFPQLCITAVVVPGYEVGEVGDFGERFIDNKRIEGTIPQMLDDAVAFVNKHMAVKTIVDAQTGKRRDRPEYPINAVREAMLNALIHRDYSIHTEGMPVQVQLFKDRLEIHNPGGLYGRITIDQLGKVQPDTRNPRIATMLEDLGITENRYSGIPTIRKEMANLELAPPIFDNARNNFVVKLLNVASEFESNDLLAFCKVPRTRTEVAQFLGLGTNYYVMQNHILPLLKEGKLEMTMPDKPRSKNQRFITKKHDKGKV
jgi:ATP-dependent DNA helicase RecG